MIKKKIKKVVEREEWCSYWSIQFNRGKYYPQVRWEYYTGEKNYHGEKETKYYYDELKDGCKTYQKAFDFIISIIGEENL